MCGIVGVLHFDSGRPVDHALLQRMTDVLAHRGPDGRGVHVDGAAGLGHRRLAIIDLSAEASQPMTNEDGTVWVVFNGEIYNFKQLRDELLARGHAFRSRSDTEVLVHLYEEYGDDLVQRLRGMFAFAIWDARRRRLLLARDRFGQKPLYYQQDAGALRFASEVKAMLEDPEVPRAADPEAIDDYLTYGYVPDPGTAFAGIQKLSPGSLLAVEASGRHRLRRYWSLPLVPKHEVARTRWSMARVEEELLGLIDEAVSLRTVADVPLGALLSGGIDFFDRFRRSRLERERLRGARGPAPGHRARSPDTSARSSARFGTYRVAPQRPAGRPILPTHLRGLRPGAPARDRGAERRRR
jgi:asparagine synthase (glutamine-hydrolysing)